MDTDGGREGLSLTELARRADVTPRTVRYYIAQGLIPAPQAGPGQHYGQGQLQRIALIKRLQREHLPLAEIRGRLAALDDAAVTAALTGAETADDEVSTAHALEAATSPDQERALSYIRRVLDEGASRRAGSLRRVIAPSAHRAMGPPPLAATPPGAGAEGQIAPTAPTGRPSLPSRPAARYEPQLPDEYPIRPDPHAPGPPSMPSMPGPGLQPRTTPWDRSTWERIPLAADLELHVRRPLDRETNRRLDRLLAFARELFEGT